MVFRAAPPSTHEYPSTGPLSRNSSNRKAPPVATAKLSSRDTAPCTPPARYRTPAEHRQPDVADTGVRHAHPQIGLRQHADRAIEQAHCTQSGQQPVQILRHRRRQRYRNAAKTERRASARPAAPSAPQGRPARTAVARYAAVPAAPSGQNRPGRAGKNPLPPGRQQLGQQGARSKPLLPLPAMTKSNQQWHPPAKHDQEIPAGRRRPPPVTDQRPSRK